MKSIDVKKLQYRVIAEWFLILYGTYPPTYKDIAEPLAMIHDKNPVIYALILNRFEKMKNIKTTDLKE